MEECAATLGLEVLGEVLMPLPGLTEEESEALKVETEDRTEPEDLLEWIGCQALGIKL